MRHAATAPYADGERKLMFVSRNTMDYIDPPEQSFATFALVLCIHVQ
jgi:hypothetical protein